MIRTQVLLKRIYHSLKELPITFLFIGICILVYLFQLFFGRFYVYFLAYYRPFILAGEYWRLLTVGFCHFDFFHIFMNLYGVWIYGNIFERQLGSLRYFVLLVGSILGGSLFLLFRPTSTLAVGLSGGLYGLMAAIIFLYIRTGAIQNPQFRSSLMRLVFINVLINFMPNIAFMAHLGGFVAGMLLIIALDKDTDKSLAINSFIATVILFVAITYFGFTKKEMPEPRLYDLDVAILRAENHLFPDSKHVEYIAKRLDVLYDTDIIWKNVK